MGADAPFGRFEWAAYTGTITDLVSVSAGGTLFVVTLAPNTSATPIVPNSTGTMLIVERIS